MRQLYVPARWAAAAVAVMATAGCMSIGDDGGGEPGPARSAGERSAAAAPDGGSVTPGAGSAGKSGADRGDAKGKKGKKGKKGGGKERSGAHGESGSDAAQASASATGGGGDPAPPTKGGRPAPTRTKPDPPRPTPTPEPPKPTPTPTPEPTPEPSSSAHEPPKQDAQLGERSEGLRSREPSPEAGPA
ncbi:lipoprotein [Streptomyces durmitorensis]|uniref:Lipoprotein n=1 Tax=Streptomyces durmitorensis TaxID=319947 RepID=A0ABY4PW49_9ACTN|nr:hypothetical protein [Streptomyces durmitorensis]UQT57667.1 hypothetical protein M4V62_22630 [Streptomyces durmitorensis]